MDGAAGSTSDDAISAAFGASSAFVIDVLEGGGKLITDSGGLTKWGISKRAHPEVDVGSLTRYEALAIYHREYWTVIRGDLLPRGLDLLVFDAAVNMGVPWATKLLQDVLEVAQDGIVGRQTLSAARGYRPQRELRARYNEIRIRTYFDLVRRKPHYQQYMFGWTCRVFRLADEAGRVGGAA